MGESAVLNEKELKKHYSKQWSPREYAKAAHIFLTAGVDKGARVDFSRRRLVGIGHSVGASAMFLMKELNPIVNFEIFIAIEPGISLKGNRHTNVASEALTAWTWLRPDEYGLRTHYAAKYDPPFTFNGVTTASTNDELVVDSLTAYAEVTQRKPVHVIWGTINDVKSPETRDLLSDTSAGRKPASVRFVENAGHLVVQQQPEAVAEKILDVILGKPAEVISKL
ncbi:hypothetical protein D9757_009665 [Collybiopsis confluens]|uniref:AB hydrolase-1 domain-containing protein n=1 Tax=Collybiopsis confluens TaxID=2823264 RepID=A0A8H5H270_9AGAR|nr:hypothetical protein D9757_009665 [Collybiopsis confluens]